MNAQSVNNLNSSKNSNASAASEIDIVALFGALIDKKIFLLVATILSMLIGVAVAIFSTPIYQATSIIQVEEKGGAVPGFDELGGILSGASAAVTEIELIKSRAIIGEAVDSLNLDVIAVPKVLPILGERSFRVYKSLNSDDIADPFLGFSSYAWGGEKIEVFRFAVPQSYEGVPFTLITGNNNEYQLIDINNNVVLSGVVGKKSQNEGVELTLSSLNARAGTEFLLMKNSRLSTIISLQNSIKATEKGRDSGILELSLMHSNPEYAKNVLNNVAQTYVRQNVERSSAEALQSLEFLKVQLPSVKKQLEEAENRFNEYKVKQQSVDISLETQSVLQQIVKLDTKLQELELKKREVGRKFKQNHPIYQGVIEQIEVVEKQKKDLSEEINILPETQQELLRLTRDVSVNNEIYTMLLARAQELDIVRAGTVGNVRIIDSAEVNTAQPVKPKKPLIVVMFTLIGIVLASSFVLIRHAIHKGIEDPSDIEAIGLPVYASVPYSEYQVKLTGFAKARKGKTAKAKSILALDNPADLSIEALRSLRTSLHFAMMEAKNNVIAISGPSPGVGKSFISVNLATVLAQSDKKVLIIDADMRKGYLQTQFGMEWDNGLSDYLSGRLSLTEVTKSSQVKGLDVITRGQIPPNPSELLMHENFLRLVEEVSAKYDLVIIDTPPILAVTDPAIVSAHAGTTLLVTRFGQNHVKEIELTRNRFEQNGIDVKGVVFNGVVRKASNAYGYYGYYNYEYKSDK
jgi:tyrosine-protein kinase Etk/Wzc